MHLLETSIGKTFSKNNKYTLYEIICITNLSKNKNCYFKIYKRYSDFLTLHQKLLKCLKDIPPFPKKRYYKMERETIVERVIMFDNYLKYLCIMISSGNLSKESRDIITRFLNIESTF